MRHGSDKTNWRLCLRGWQDLRRSLFVMVLLLVLPGTHLALAADNTGAALPQPFWDQANAAQGSVQDVLNKRCVVCHGCYDAPCQLKLSSPDGWLRGASKTKVYDSSRLTDAPMTRLGVDAKTVPGWRAKGFFPVTNTGESGQASVLEQMLKAGRTQAFRLGAPLPEEIDISPLRRNSCPAPSDMGHYLNDHRFGGMPFATAPLPDKDYQKLLDWAARGAPVPQQTAPLPEEVQDKVDTIEAFFNRDTLRQKLVSRYLFEHLFLAQLHLEGGAPRRFFRLIRSRTGPGETADEIPFRRPFDDPGGPFFYRLVPLKGTILHKEHIVYRIGPERLDRYRDLFFAGDWTLDTLPPYSRQAGGNPLSTFQAIPARSRYQFLLDDALYFVRTFIRGPVCYGQVAVNVIQDRFWVSFLAPGSDLSVTDPDYLKDAIPILELPVAMSSDTLSKRLKSFLQVGPIKYQAFRQARYARRAKTEGGLGYKDIWDGDGNNPDARLTIYRNFSSASVVRGFAGAIPKTAWVIDFPLFERIYYDLVAGFDVFGNVEHQLTTRIYMDNLRREGERMFLYFLPPTARKPLHDSWYRGPLANLIDLWKESPLDTASPSGVTFTTRQPKSEFLSRLLQIPPALWPQSDPVNRCEADACAPAASTAGQLRALTGSPAPFAKFLPDISILMVETGSKNEIFTLVHDMAHSNVAFIFNEDLRREPDKDTLTIVPGQFSSYPNFIFSVTDGELPAFISRLKAVRTQRAFLDLVRHYGIRRTDPRFWASLDRIQAGLNAQDAVQAGLLDINRYRDPKPLDPIERLFQFTFSIDEDT